MGGTKVLKSPEDYSIHTTSPKETFKEKSGDYNNEVSSLNKDFLLSSRKEQNFQKELDLDLENNDINDDACIVPRSHPLDFDFENNNPLKDQSMFLELFTTTWAKMYNMKLHVKMKDLKWKW